MLAPLLAAGVGAAEGWGNPAADAPHLAPRLPAAVSARRWLHGQLTPPRAPGAAAALAALHPHSPQLADPGPRHGLNPSCALTPGPHTLSFPRGDTRCERPDAAGRGESEDCGGIGLGSKSGAAAPMLHGIAALARRLGAARAALQALAGPEGLGPCEGLNWGIEPYKADLQGSPAVHLEARADACAAWAPSATGTSHSSSLDASPGAGALVCARPRAPPHSMGARNNLERAQLEDAQARDAADVHPSSNPRVTTARSGFLRRPLPRLDVVSPSASAASQGESCALGTPWGEGSREGTRGGHSARRSAIQAFYGPVDQAAEESSAWPMSPGESRTWSYANCARDSQASGRRSGSDECKHRRADALCVAHGRARCAAGDEAMSAASAAAGERRGSPQKPRRRRLLRRVAGRATRCARMGQTVCACSIPCLGYAHCQSSCYRSRQAPCNHAFMRRALAVVPLMAVAAAMQQGGIVPWTRPSAGPSEGALEVEPIVEVRKARIVG